MAASGGKARAAQRRAPLFGGFFDRCAFGDDFTWQRGSRRDDRRAERGVGGEEEVKKSRRHVGRFEISAKRARTGAGTPDARPSKIHFTSSLHMLTSRPRFTWKDRHSASSIVDGETT